jgi:hypothetical protein
VPPCSTRHWARRFAMESGVTASMCPASGEHGGERAGELHAEFELERTPGSPAVLCCMLLCCMLCWELTLMQLLQTVRKLRHCYTIYMLSGARGCTLCDRRQA